MARLTTIFLIPLALLLASVFLIQQKKDGLADMTTMVEAITAKVPVG